MLRPRLGILGTYLLFDSENNSLENRPSAETMCIQLGMPYYSFSLGLEQFNFGQPDR